MREVGQLAEEKQRRERTDRVFLGHFDVGIGQLLARKPLGAVRVVVLEVEVVFSILVEFGRSDVESDLDLGFVAGLLDGGGEELERFLGGPNVGCEAALVADVGRCPFFQPFSGRSRRELRTIDAVLALDDRLERVVDLSSDAHRLFEG